MTAGEGGRRGEVAGNETTRSGGYYHLLKAVIYRDLVVWLRYPVNAATGLLVTLIFFGLIFYGGRLVAGQAIDDTIEGLIVGYFLWTLAQGSYYGITSAIQAEASWGTLERHFMTPFGFGPVILAKSIAVILRTFLTSAVVLAAMLVMTGRSIELPVVTVIVVATLAVASVFGLGLAMGGLSVLYKRINNLVNLLQFVFIALISAPVFEIPWTRALPLVQGSALLQVVMRDGVRLWELDPLALAILVGTAGLYLGAGYAMFVLTTRRARRLGVLGDY
ncbi:ABC-type multidrug transport system, permease component [Halorhabdus sp. SVX81]|uniref:ABC transporter permease n=1 Tax=Halorhabdus sp. SVX81 TaxID=2978283 RepID=UPI0023DBB2F5|nr:ABC transporter permease [Halorhabdus sp. SVX81]WEL17070.1 ABC-type multidrug transport system, permease component [Halorhabdus sp. SVX81]